MQIKPEIWGLTSASSEDFSSLHNRNKALGLKWVLGHYLTLTVQGQLRSSTSQTSLACLYFASVDTETIQDLDLCMPCWKSCCAHLSAAALAL